MLLKRFFQERHGSVLPLFAVAVVPIVGFMGAAIDYSRVSSVRTEMQAALDATALMLSKEPKGQSDTALTTKADGYFRAMFNRPEGQNIVINAKLATAGAMSVTVGGTGTVPTTFSRLLGFPSVDFAASSTVKWGSTKLQVAIALDNTGSMASASKMSALKTATHQLLTTLETAAASPGDVTVAIIPFAREVNVGASNFNADWIDWTDWQAPPANSMPGPNDGPGSDCPYSNSNNGFRCTTGPTNGSSTTSTIPSSGSYKGYICPSIDNGSQNSARKDIYYNGCYDSVPTTTTSTNVVDSGKGADCNGASNCSCSGNGKDKVCTQTVTTTGAPYTHNWIANAKSTWNGCVTDRDQSYDVLNTAPNSDSKPTFFPARQSSYCPVQQMPLTSTWSSLNSLVDQMQPDGNTNQAIGLAWAWQALTPTAPLNAPPKPADTRQIIILFTDGMNTQDRWYTDQASIDARQKISCANVKAADIVLYTVQVTTEGDPVSTMLKQCASPDDVEPKGPKFFFLTSGSQVVTTFNTIGTSLAKLRIAK